MLPFSSTLLFSPARSDIYKGIIGRTQGDTKESRPSKNVAPKSLKSIVYLKKIRMMIPIKTR